MEVETIEIIDKIADDPLQRIQMEISEIAQREKELHNGYVMTSSTSSSTDSSLLGGVTQSLNGENGVTNGFQTGVTNGFQTGVNGLTNGDGKVNQNGRRVFQKSLSTPGVLPFKSQPNRTYVGQKGIMQRFIKSRGRLSMNTINVEQPWNYDEPRAKHVQIAAEKKERKGYIPAEEKIQTELKDLQLREAELKAHRKRALASSQPDLLAAVDDETDSEDEGYGRGFLKPNQLKGARSIAHLCDDESVDGSSNSSAPSSLRPAKSLAQLCDNLDDGDVPSSRDLISKFESIIQKNREKNV